jgi:hypothetical protein
MVTLHLEFLHPWNRATVVFAVSKILVLAREHAFVNNMHPSISYSNIYTTYVPNGYMTATFVIQSSRNPLIRHPYDWTGIPVSTTPGN